MGRFVTQTSAFHTNIISGTGITGGEELLSTFARKADLSIGDAQRIIDGDHKGINKGKVDKLTQAIEHSFGNLDRFKEAQASLDMSP